MFINRSYKKIFVITTVSICILLMSLLFGIGLCNESSVTSRSGITRVGNTAPPFNMTLFSGHEFDLLDINGKPVVVNFWASWCAPCKQEALILQEMWKTYQDKVEFVGGAIQDSETDSINHLREFAITYPNGADTTGSITIDYGVIGIPVTFFITEEGIIKQRWVGAIRKEDMVKRINELIN